MIERTRKNAKIGDFSNKFGATEQVVFEPPRIAAHALFTLKNPDMFIIKDTPIEVLKREAEVIDYIL